MIVDEVTTSYVEPAVPLSERERGLHVHYASNALARGHAPDCDTVTVARNWPQIVGRPACSCSKGAR